jgi:hypothetical protein
MDIAVSSIASGSAGASGSQPQQTRWTAYSEEQLLMELLAQEKEDEILDDGALEGSGDKYSGN